MQTGSQGTAGMTGGDLIVLAPWVIFGAGMIVISIRLLARRRASRRHSAPPARRDADPRGNGEATQQPRHR
jgi:hypothetical protein